MRYFENPYPEQDATQSEDVVNKTKVVQLIEFYVDKIAKKTTSCENDLYVGLSGIAFMYLKIHQSQAIPSLNSSALNSAEILIAEAKKTLSGNKASLLCGDAGIFCVSAIVNHRGGHSESLLDMKRYLEGYDTCKKKTFNHYGNDEILFGRAGYLSGIYWLNQNLSDKISSEIILELCLVTIQSGAEFAERNKLNIPLMWECYNSRYLGAAHGISAILHMLLESPMFPVNGNVQLNENQQLVKNSIDSLLHMQSDDGNFPCVLEDARKKNHELVHWCHGAPGAVYLFAKAYLIFKEPKYLTSCLKIGELVWQKGLLRKGPGICHGVAGNGYVFLLLYRLTKEVKHLYRASRFADFLVNEKFLSESNKPDSPYSLFEGLAGTVCFLIDLLQPEKAAFPFMDVFDVKYM